MLVWSRYLNAYPKNPITKKKQSSRHTYEEYQRLQGEEIVYSYKLPFLFQINIRCRIDVYNDIIREPFI